MNNLQRFVGVLCILTIATIVYAADGWQTTYNQNEALADGDVFAVIDVSNTTDGDDGTTEYVLWSTIKATIVDGTAYSATWWNNDYKSPTKDAVRDKFVSVDSAISGKEDADAAIVKSDESETIASPWTFASIRFSSPSGDGSATGIIISRNVGETVAIGETGYYDFTDGEYKIADQSATTTMPVTVVFLEAKDNGEACLMLLSGEYRNDALFDLSAGSVYASTTGDFTQSAPSTGIKQYVGYALDANTIFFNPSPITVNYGG